jgi:hypothetical protein
MADKKKFDYSIFGCNEKQVREFAAHFGLDKGATEDGGVLVVPGQTLYLGGTGTGRAEEKVIVAPWDKQSFHIDKICVYTIDLARTGVMTCKFKYSVLSETKSRRPVRGLDWHADTE